MSGIAAGGQVLPVPRKVAPIMAWAALGAILLAFEIYVLGSWLLGSNFIPTPPGADPISPAYRNFLIGVQVAVPLATLACWWVWIIKPILRERRVTSDVMIASAAVMIFFWDMCMNYTSVQLLYNSHMVNFGAWANGSWPGWISPKAQLLPEPIFVSPPGYTCLVFGQVVFICWLLRKASARWGNLSVFQILGLIVLGLTVVDSLIEIALLRSGLYAYPGSIRAITLFAGETYQFPLSEGFLFGGLGLGAIAALKFFKDDRGQTFVERGVEQLRYSAVGKQWLRFLAIFGFCHGAFLALYMVPNQWLAMHADAFPAGYPTYMINGMCASGDDGRQCPGPGVAMPRPPYPKG